MNNYENAERKLYQARYIYDELLKNYNNGYWNIIIRKAQEVFELYIRTLLTIMCIEYPKSHNVGQVFSRVCKEKNLGIDYDILERIVIISKDLAEKRSPAFYVEEVYTHEDAEKAKAQQIFPLY